ncbi:hypothetical protein M408DRAFT_24630 [Serendipita vermifera MAFF 305830]|uniref:Uncharacterized protein n=1 Tax=Serendipita vermifera MAFF 305830 TaxID=933852 RepID=A0A0C2WMB3_SERVB|nr:hypothetical protein M408DRAFT_24630 [Serendipita vermifera MAFF 305830]
MAAGSHATVAATSTIMPLYHADYSQLCIAISRDLDQYPEQYLLRGFCDVLSYFVDTIITNDACHCPFGGREHTITECTMLRDNRHAMEMKELPWAINMVEGCSSPDVCEFCLLPNTPKVYKTKPHTPYLFQHHPVDMGTSLCTRRFTTIYHVVIGFILSPTHRQEFGLPEQLDGTSWGTVRQLCQSRWRVNGITLILKMLMVACLASQRCRFTFHHSYRFGGLLYDYQAGSPRPTPLDATPYYSPAYTAISIVYKRLHPAFRQNVAGYTRAADDDLFLNHRFMRNEADNEETTADRARTLDGMIPALLEILVQRNDPA